MVPQKQCQDTCQISKQWENSDNYEYRVFETLWDQIAVLVVNYGISNTIVLEIP